MQIQYTRRGHPRISCIFVTGAGTAVHTNPCERLSVRVAVARVALRQCCAYAVWTSLSVTPCASVRLRRVRLSLSVTILLNYTYTYTRATVCARGAGCPR